MEFKTIVAIVLVVVIVGGFVFLQIKNRKSNLIVCGAELNSAPFIIRSDIDGSTKNRGGPRAFRFKRLSESKV